MMVKQMLTGVLAALSVFMLYSCAGSHQARSVSPKSAVLVNPDILQEGDGNQALYRYVNPRFDIKNYTAIIVEPVLIAKDGEMSASQRKNLQKLANNAYVYLVQALEKNIKIVKETGKGTLNLQMAIRDADSSKPVRTITSSITPIGAGLSLVKYTATGKQSGVGEITAEFRVTDDTTGELLVAALDRRVGNKAVQGIWDTWYNADEALRYWSTWIGYLLCTHRQESGCVKL